MNNKCPIAIVINNNYTMSVPLQILKPLGGENL